MQDDSRYRSKLVVVVTVDSDVVHSVASLCFSLLRGGQVLLSPVQRGGSRVWEAGCVCILKCLHLRLGLPSLNLFWGTGVTIYYSQIGVPVPH